MTELQRLFKNRWHGMVLVLLREHGPLRYREIISAMHEVSAGLHVSDPDVNRALGTLQERGLARKVLSDTDRRYRHALTPAGAEKAERIQLVFAILDRHLAEGDNPEN